MITTLPPLLGGPYTAPSLRVGDRTTCLVRDCAVVVTSWTDAEIPWRAFPTCLVMARRDDS